MSDVWHPSVHGGSFLTVSLGLKAKGSETQAKSSIAEQAIGDWF
jgi:hypothetical protein